MDSLRRYVPRFLLAIGAGVFGAALVRDFTGQSGTILSYSVSVLLAGLCGLLVEWASFEDRRKRFVTVSTAGSATNNGSLNE
jgi:hypothetical protein